MSKDTVIQWCDSTVNPTLGCDGCELWNETTRICYAGGLTTRYGKSNPGLANDFDVVGVAPDRMVEAANWSDLTGEPRLAKPRPTKPRSAKPWLNGLPRLIFVGDMADNFSKDVSFEYLLEEVVAAAMSGAGLQHQWLWLTKRPSRMAHFSEWLSKRSISWPPNLWAGTSITTQQRTTRINALLDVGDERTIRFVSVEPQWDSVNLRPWLSRLDWVIQGGQSGSHDHPFDLQWADDLREQCREHRVAYFLKQFGSCVTHGGERVQLGRGHNGDWSHWPRRLRVRQMPICVGRRRTRSIVQRLVG